MMKNRIQLLAVLFAMIALTACGAKPTSAPPTGVVLNALVTIEAAAEFETSLAKQESALNSGEDTASKTEAGNALEIVDEMERLY